MVRLKSEAEALLQERRLQLLDFERAAAHPPTQYTSEAWGALPGEPLAEFPRALRRMMLELGVDQALADRLIDNSKGMGSEGKGKKGEGKGKKGEGKGKKGEGKGKKG